MKSFTYHTLMRGFLLSGALGIATSVVAQTTEIETAEFNLQHGLKVMHADEAYRLGFTGKGVMVSIIDSGIDTDHSEFYGRLLPGYDLGTLQEFLPQSGNRDEGRHGTHVAGIIAANKDGKGMHGVAYESQIFMLKIGDDELGKGFIQASEMGPRIINISLGLNDCSKPELSDYFCNVTEYSVNDIENIPEESLVVEGLRALHAKDVLMVIAAANSVQPHPDVIAGMPYLYPELKDGVIAVTSVSEYGKIATYSNHCGVAADWCLSAPGGAGDVGIISTVPLGTYHEFWGTSMAAPQVAGVAALVAEAFPYFGANQLQQTLFTTATPLGDKAIYGWGLVNAGKAVRGPAQFIGVFDTNTQGFDSVFSNDITGTGSLIKRGQGRLELSGNNTFPSAQVVDGELAVTGFTVAQVVVDQAARLSGDGSIANVNTAGVVAPGVASTNALGQLTVSNNFTASRTAILEIATTIDGQSSGVDVKGASALDGIQVALKGNTFRPSVTYTVLNSDQGITGTAGSVVGGSTTFLTSTLEQSPQQLQVRVARNSLRFDQFVQTANQRAVAQGLDAHSSGLVAGLQPLYDKVLNSDEAILPALTQQLGGEVYSTTQSALVQSDRRWAQQLLGQSRGLQQTKSATPAWVQVSTTRSQLGAKDGISAAKFNQSGVALGVEIPLNTQWQLGAALGYQHGKLTLNDLVEEAKSKSYSAAIYAQSQWPLAASTDQLNWLTGLSLSRHHVNYKRHLNALDTQRLTSSADSTSYQLFTELAWQMAFSEQWSFSPFVGAGWLHSRHGKMSEEGGYAALRRTAQTENTGYTQLGMRNGYEWLQANGQANRIYVDVAWQHSMGKSQPRSALSFAQNNNVSFTTQGASLSRNSLQLGLAAELALTKASQLSLAYEGAFAGSASRQHGGMVRLQHRF